MTMKLELSSGYTERGNKIISISADGYRFRRVSGDNRTLDTFLIGMPVHPDLEFCVATSGFMRICQIDKDHEPQEIAKWEDRMMDENPAAFGYVKDGEARIWTKRGVFKIYPYDESALLDAGIERLYLWG